MSINKVAISGNLTRDPEVRQTQSGTQVTNFSVAVNERRNNPQTGEWENYPNFIDCVFFDKNGNRTNFFTQVLHKGSKVAVSGKLRYSSWEKDGQKRSKVEVVVDEIEVMVQGDRQQGGYQQNGYQGQGGYQQPQQGYQQQPQGYQQQGGYQQQQQRPPAQAPASGGYEDIPF